MCPPALPSKTKKGARERPFDFWVLVTLVLNFVDVNRLQSFGAFVHLKFHVVVFL